MAGFALKLSFLFVSIGFSLKNTSCRHQRTMAHHWKNSILTPGSVAQYLFCQGLGCCALLRPRSLKAASDTRDQLYATTRFKPSKKCRGWSQEDLQHVLGEKNLKKLGRGVSGWLNLQARMIRGRVVKPLLEF